MLGRNYNYPAFTAGHVPENFALSSMRGPQPGSRAPQFTLPELDGDEISLSQFQGRKPVLLTFGSATCPQTALSIRRLNELHDNYGSDVQFLFCYVREAHPGERIPAHGSMSDKQRAARALQREEKIDFPILIDDLKGTVHSKYGKLPNPTFVISRDGTIVFRSMFSNVAALERALEDITSMGADEDAEIVAGGEDTTIPFSLETLYSVRALERGGSESLRNFRRTMDAPAGAAHAVRRVVRPVTDNPGAALAIFSMAAGVIAAGIFFGREWRNRQFTARTADRYRAAEGYGYDNNMYDGGLYGRDASPRAKSDWGEPTTPGLVPPAQDKYKHGIYDYKSGAPTQKTGTDDEPIGGGD